MRETEGLLLIADNTCSLGGLATRIFVESVDEFTDERNDPALFCGMEASFTNRGGDAQSFGSKRFDFRPVGG